MEYYNPTSVAWCSWRDMGNLLPTIPQNVMIFTSGSSRIKGEELRNRYGSFHQIRLAPPISQDPSISSVQHVTELIRYCEPQWLIALGGGSVMDTVKAGALIAKHEGQVSDYLRGEKAFTNRAIPVIAIPTTAGSGSEVTPYASITDSDRGNKQSLTHVDLYPRQAIIDPTTTLTLDARQTAISGMDALSHYRNRNVCKKSSIAQKRMNRYCEVHSRNDNKVAD